MQIERTSYFIGAVVAAGLVAAPFWAGGEPDTGIAAAADPDPIVIAPDEIEWMEGPPSIPSGADVAVLEGDPSAEGEIFVFRIRFPAGYTLPPHFHPVNERVTVISGTFHFGMGETLDRDRARALPAGSQFMMPPGHPHFAFTEDEGAVIQLTSTGPWAIEYVDPADDPRQRTEGR